MSIENDKLNRSENKVPIFYLSENRKVMSVFQHYEIASYSSGILEFEVTL